jgi:hypothetical protein
MYQPMLFLHWKQIKVALIPFTIAAFGIPLVSVQGMGAGATSSGLAAYDFLMGAQLWVTLFPMLAGAIGVTLALSAWNWDHQLNHVHALSLPIRRWRYATLKMGAGAVLAVLPALAFWAGAHVAAASITLPEGLHAYPDALALRFFLAELVSYAILFAMAAGTVRTTLVIFTACFVFLFVGGSLNGFLGREIPYFQDVNVVQAVMNVLVGPHGPFEVFSGSWMLIDV